MIHLTTREHLIEVRQRLGYLSFARALCGEIPTMPFLTTRVDRTDCPFCLEAVGAASIPPPPAPLTTWKAIAAAVGVSERTLARRRRAGNDRSRPYFPDAEAAITWYGDLAGARPPPKAGRRTISRPRQPSGDDVAEFERVRRRIRSQR